MKYFTKEWYKAVQRSMILNYTPIPDKDCYEEDIARLYQGYMEDFLKVKREVAKQKYSEKVAKSAFAIRWGNSLRQTNTIFPLAASKSSFSRS